MRKLLTGFVAAAGVAAFAGAAAACPMGAKDMAQTAKPDAVAQAPVSTPVVTPATAPAGS